MKPQYLWTLLGIVLLIIVQVGGFNYVYLFRYATPSVYIFALCLFNEDCAKSWLTLAGAAIGLAVDLLSGTPGLHMAATTLVAFLRNYMLHPWIDHESIVARPPSMRHHGRGVHIVIVEMVLLHQGVLFLLDALHGFHFPYLVIRMGSSMLLTYLLVLTLQIICLEQPLRRKG